jgi:hypothetical protein
MERGRDDAESHREIVDLLPWLINETLPEEEVKRVKTHLASCSPCQNELEELKGLQATVISLNESLLQPSVNLADRVMDRIATYEAEPAKTKQQKPGIKRLWSYLAGLWSPLPIFVRTVIAIQLVTIVVLAGVLALYLPQPDTYRTLAGKESTKGELVRIKVVFQGNAPEKEVRELLVSIKGTIVDGPSTMGFYTIGFPVPDGSESERVLDVALEQLRSRPEIVKFAEAMP